MRDICKWFGLFGISVVTWVSATIGHVPGEDLDKFITTQSTEQSVIDEVLPESSPKSVQQTDSLADLFYENSDGTYNYCPSVLTDSDMIHTFYCSNITDYQVIDHICYRESAALDNGYSYSDKYDVLQPTAGSWDSVHVCDPSVISGDFLYNGNSYQYLMAYLGCNSMDNQNNKIGLAVSNQLDSGWVKCNNINPFIDFDYDERHLDAFQWGVGQPSLINLGNNQVLVFYTKGTYNLTCEMAELYDLSDLSYPVKLGETVVNNMSGDFISNADFALDGNIIYMTCDSHPFQSGVLDNIADHSTVYAGTLDSDVITSLGSIEWESIYSVDAFVSGHARNHNTGFVRDVYGNLSSRSILYTSADECNNFSDSLWTYRLHLVDFGH